MALAYEPCLSTKPRVQDASTESTSKVASCAPPEEQNLGPHVNGGDQQSEVLEHQTARSTLA